MMHMTSRAPIRALVGSALAGGGFLFCTLAGLMLTGCASAYYPAGGGNGAAWSQMVQGYNQQNAALMQQYQVRPAQQQTKTCYTQSGGGGYSYVTCN